jgi:SSS family solute:Na+ symporter
MKLKDVGGESGLVITQNAKDELDKNNKEANIIKLSEAIDLKFQTAEDSETKESYSRLKNVVTQNKSSYEVKSLAYIFAQKNYDFESNEWKASDKWSDPLQDEGLVYIQIANPSLPINKLGHDLAYPTMMNYLPSGLLGLVLAALIAAFMSTISTHLNWGSSYISNDLYKRFYKKDATQKDMVFVGRVSTVVLMILAAWAALKLENAKQIFDIIILLGAGTGLIFILRWFWWRINAYSELVAMIASFVITYYLKFVHVQVFEFDRIPNHIELLIGVGLTTLIWVVATFLTRPTDQEVLIDFYKKVRPGKSGWQPVIAMGVANKSISHEEVTVGKLPIQILCMFIGSIMVYAALFCVGFWLYGQTGDAILATAISVGCALALMRLWRKL